MHRRHDDDDDKCATAIGQHANEINAQDKWPSATEWYWKYRLWLNKYEPNQCLKLFRIHNSIAATSRSQIKWQQKKTIDVVQKLKANSLFNAPALMKNYDECAIGSEEGVEGRERERVLMDFCHFSRNYYYCSCHLVVDGTHRVPDDVCDALFIRLLTSIFRWLKCILMRYAAYCMRLFLYW